MTHPASAARPSTTSDDSTTSSDSSTTRGDGYIHVVGWEKFQHYQTGRNSKKTDMKWIRCYTELLDKDEYLALAATDRALLHAIWMATGKLGNCRCSSSVGSMKRRFGLNRVSLERLIHAGWVEVHPMQCGDPPRPEAEAETETEPAIEGLREPKVDEPKPRTRPESSVEDPATEPSDEYDRAARRLLEACDAPMDGRERFKLLMLRAQGASVGSIESARERVLTKRGPMRNPFGLAVSVIQAESDLREVSA